MDNSLKEIRKEALINGLILAAVLLVLDILALYILAYSKSIVLIILAYLLVYLALPLLAAIYLVKNLREKIGGYWSFRQATSGIFVIFLTGSLLSSIGNFLFIKLNSTIIPIAKANFINVFTRFMSKTGADTSKVDEVVEDIEARFELMANTNLSGFFSSFLSSIIILFVVALIFAAIFKREQPIRQTEVQS